MAASVENRVSNRKKAAPLAVVLLLCFLEARGGAVVWNSLNDDLLLPYPPRQHGPPHPHRYVRDCQPLRHGNTTHESWPSDNSTASPLTVTRGFVSDFPAKGQNRRKVYGHITTVRNPLRTFSVLEPGRQGGCRSRIRATVEETARHSKCLVAQNGGYFNMVTGECLGNVVSEGQLVQNSGGVQNAQFGIRKDGTLVFGYLSEEDVLADENPFVQLVSGVVWLLRNGEIYVNQSLMAECDETQKTGTFDKFINVVSARTAVGHDQEGRLVLAHVDGQTEARGLSLWEMAEFLKDHGVINAINLDGGGSATLVLNGTLASYPSDHCQPDPMWRCARPISTVLCVHEPACQPRDCSGHGHCVLGQCHCIEGVWSGPACDVLDCGPSNCAPHGKCTETGCLCDAGWMGANCSEACAGDSYGDGCLQRCLCRNGGRCSPVNGSCACSPGYQGTVCDEVCPLGQYGENCQHACQCSDQCACDPKTGSCNISEDSSMAQEVTRVQHCLLKATEGFLFTEKTWIAITLGSLILLLLSAAINIKLFLGSSKQRGERYKYTYHPLQEINGETQLFAAWEKDHMEENWDNETEKVELL